mmetsp:Transcript_43174/g.68253  ORF Transcript_43174/g.68253 Transcript_43174/m.68253 type:complete len:207 (-) Transcript_43174:12-632(-)
MGWLPDHIWLAQQQQKQQQSGKSWGVTQVAYSKPKPQWQNKPNQWQNKQKAWPKFDQSGGKLGEFIGKLSRKQNTQKYGFIECSDLKAQGYDDAFVLGTELKHFEDGKEVTFTAFLNGDGKLQGRDLRQKKDESGGVLGEFKGKITSVGPKFGFIDCASLKPMGHDSVFVLRDELKQYEQGNIVKFTAIINSKGQANAKNLKSGLK